MNRSAIIAIHIVALLVVPMATWAEPETDAQIAGRFHTRWTDVRYNKSVVLHNPDVSRAKQETSEGVSVSCEIEIRDPNLVVGISRDCVVERVTDDKGQEVTVPVTSRGIGPHYGGLEYRTRFAPPVKPPRWKLLLRSFLRLPQNTNLPPQLVSELEPSRFQVEVPRESAEQGVREIRHIEGYFHALMAESYVYVDVPFEPNDHWASLTAGVEILVREAKCDGSSYQCRIETRPQGGGKHIGPIQVGDTLPDRMVVDRQLIGADGKPVDQPHRSPLLTRSVDGNIRGHIGGTGGNLKIQCIRFTIAVDPDHKKVPFELEHIPLPQSEP